MLDRCYEVTTLILDYYMFLDIKVLVPHLSKILIDYPAQLPVIEQGSTDLVFD